MAGGVKGVINRVNSVRVTIVRILLFIDLKQLWMEMKIRVRLCMQQYR